MDEFGGKTVVITGAASGIGAALANAFAKEGARLVIADVDEVALAERSAELEAMGVEFLSMETDVSEESQVQRLAAASVERFGEIHVVCNNAGVVHGGNLWDANRADFDWVMGVNLWGVIHGVRTFVPILKEQACDSHIVNTASMAAFVTLAFSGIYSFTKAAVLSLTETLFHELEMEAPHVGVSALCPEYVRTHLTDAPMRKPKAAAGAMTADQKDVESMVMEQLGECFAAEGVTSPEAIADRTLEAIRERRLYVLSSDGEAFHDRMKERFDNLLERRNPEFNPPLPGAE